MAVKRSVCSAECQTMGSLNESMAAAVLRTRSATSGTVSSSPRYSCPSSAGAAAAGTAFGVRSSPPRFHPVGSVRACARFSSEGSTQGISAPFGPLVKDVSKYSVRPVFAIFAVSVS